MNHLSANHLSVDHRAPKTIVDHEAKLVKDHRVLVNAVKDMKSYFIDKSPHIPWKTGSTHSCVPEIGPAATTGRAMSCPAESPRPCKFMVTYKDSQTFKEMGFYAEFSIESAGGMSGIYEARVTTTFGSSYSYTKEFNHGIDLGYEFPVAPGLSCTPTQVSY